MVAVQASSQRRVIPCVVKGMGYGFRVLADPVTKLNSECKHYKYYRIRVLICPLLGYRGLET